MAAGLSGARADNISYAPDAFPSLTQTLTTLGIDGTAASTPMETYLVPGAPGTATRLDFGFVKDLGGYLFSFGFFDMAAVTADPATDRQNWAMQALDSGVLVFDNRETGPGASASVDVAAGTEIGLFLIPDDTLAAILGEPGSFFSGSRPDPLFSLAAANPGGYDQLLAFESGGLYAFAFEDLTRTGWSDEDFNDLVLTMTATPGADFSAQVDEISEPQAVWLLLSAILPLLALRRRRVIA